MLEKCANRIAYNHPKAGTIRWLDDIVFKPEVVSYIPMPSDFDEYRIVQKSRVVDTSVAPIRRRSPTSLRYTVQSSLTSGHRGTSRRKPSSL